MPGLNQLKQFTTDILALGDEAKVRASRGEKPVRAPFPKNVSEKDDSEDFLNGMPKVSEDDISQAEAAAAEKQSEGSADAKLPDVSDILNTAGDLDDADLSEFELPDIDTATQEEAPDIPVEDLDLDALLQPSGEANAPTDSTPSSSDDDFDVTSLLDDFDQTAGDAGADKDEAPATQEEAPAADDGLSDLAGLDLSGIPDVDLSSDADIPSIDAGDAGNEAALPEDTAAPVEETGLPDFSDIPSNADNETAPASAEEMELPDFSDIPDIPDSVSAPENDTVADNALDSTDSGASLDLPEDLTKLSEDDLLSGIPDLDMSQLDMPDDGAAGNADLSLDDLPAGDGSPDLPDLDLSDIDIPDLDANAELPAQDLDLGAEAPAVPADTGDAGMDLPDDFNLDNLDSLTTDSTASAQPENMGLDGFDDVPSSDVLRQEVSDDDALGPVDTSGMDGVDFSAGSSDFAFDNITDEEGEFHIPGFSDTVTADLNKKEEAPASAETEQEAEKKPKNTFTDAEYKRFLANLEFYPLNVRMAVEDFVVKNEFTDDAVFEVLDKILRKVPARQVAADLEKKLDISLQVPRDYERRSAEEYEAYKKTLEYQLKNRIIPVAILSLMAVILFFCVMFLSKTFIYEPSMARKYYKQGYTFIQENQYPQSEDSFNHALHYKSVKAWFYRYAERYREHHQYERARTMYSNILRRYNHEKAAGLAWAKMESDDLYNYEEAERILKREVLDYHVNDADGILQLGDLYLDWATDKDPAKFADAKEQYDLLVQLYGDKKEVKTYLARQMRYYIRTDNLAQVLQYKEQSFPKSKDLAADDLIELSGYLLGKRYGDLPPSEEGLRSRIEGLRGLLEDAVKAAPSNPYAMYNMGTYFRNTSTSDSDRKRASEFFKRTIEIFKERQYRNRHDTYKYIDAFRLLGEGYAAERKYIDAEQTYGEGIEIFEKEHESSGFESTQDIGRLYSDMGDIDYFISGEMETALGNYIKAVNNKNDTPSVRYRIGYIQYKNRNYPEALGSFIRSSEGSPNDSHVLLSLANTLSLRDDNYAAEGYYEKLIDVVQLQMERYNILFPQVRADHGDIVNTYLKATNNLGVTLFRIAQMTGDSKKNAQAVVHLNDSLRAWDALTRNQETMIRLEGSNLAAQNIKYITEPYAAYEPEIYTDIPKIMDKEEGLE